MSARMRWVLAIIGLLIICLALTGLVYLLWPLTDTQDRFVVPVELIVFPLGNWMEMFGEG